MTAVTTTLNQLPRLAKPQRKFIAALLAMILALDGAPAFAAGGAWRREVCTADGDFDQQDGQTDGRTTLEPIAQTGVLSADCRSAALLPAGQSRHTPPAGVWSCAGRVAGLPSAEQILPRLYPAQT